MLNMAHESNCGRLLQSIVIKICHLRNCLKRNGNNKNDIEYQDMRKKAANLFMDYMHLFSFKDFRKTLQQIEKQLLRSIVIKICHFPLYQRLIG